MPRSCSLLFALLLAALVLPGCDLFQEDEDDELSTPEGVVVGNLGRFGAQNGTLTFYDPQAGQVSGRRSVNALVQSLALRDERLYAVLNDGADAGRIDVLSAEEDAYTRTGQVLFPRPPYAVAFDGDDRAYVPAQTLGEGNVATQSIVYELTLDPLAIADSIPVGVQPVDAVVAEDKAFVSNRGSLGAGTTLSVIETGGEAADALELGCDGPGALFADGEDEVVVICQGKTVYDENFDVVDQTPGQVLFVDPEGETITRRLDGFDVQLGAATYSKETEELFVTNGSDRVFRLDTDANARASTIQVPPEEGLSGLGALAYDDADRRLYLGRRDAGDPFSAAGTVAVYERTGAETFERTGDFVAGIDPEAIVFRR